MHKNEKNVREPHVRREKRREEGGSIIIIITFYLLPVTRYKFIRLLPIDKVQLHVPITKYKIQIDGLNGTL